MIKTFNKLIIKGNNLTIIKAIYEMPTGNIILNGEKLNSFLLRKERSPVLLLLSSIVKM